MQPEGNTDTVTNSDSASASTPSHSTNMVHASAAAHEPVVLRPMVEVKSGEQQDHASNAQPFNDVAAQLAEDLRKFQSVASAIKGSLVPAGSFTDRCDQMFTVANDLFGHSPTWICFFREVLAVDGLVHRLFPIEEEYAQFMTTSHYDQLQQMLTALRSRDLPENDPNDPQRMITVRLPKSLHESLCEEAGRLKISVNKLCISRLLQVLDRKMVPETVSRPRGRKPRARTSAESSVETTNTVRS